MTLLAVLTIDLLNVQPKVHRRITVPLDIRLDRLHLIIQEAMPWTNSHLYEMQIGGCNVSGMSAPRFGFVSKLR
jgi:hypothetical protein